MMAECRFRIHQEKIGKSTHSTALEDSSENFMETLSLKCEELTHMTAELKIGGKMARTLLDTGTVGTNLMSLNRAQSNQIQTKTIDNPVEMRMATNNSRATANYTANADIYIGNGMRISCDFLLLRISSYDVILGTPFMV